MAYFKMYFMKKGLNSSQYSNQSDEIISLISKRGFVRLCKSAFEEERYLQFLFDFHWMVETLHWSITLLIRIMFKAYLLIIKRPHYSFVTKLLNLVTHLPPLKVSNCILTINITHGLVLISDWPKASKSRHCEPIIVAFTIRDLMIRHSKYLLKKKAEMFRWHIFDIKLKLLLYKLHKD